LHGYGYDENVWGYRGSGIGASGFRGKGYRGFGVWGPEIVIPFSDACAYLAAARPGGHDGVARQRNGAGSEALAALLACHLLQLRVCSLALVQRYVLQVVHAGR